MHIERKNIMFSTGILFLEFNKKNDTINNTSDGNFKFKIPAGSIRIT